VEDLADLSDDFFMKKISIQSLDFPIVIKRVVDDLVISVPDLGFFKNISLREKNNTSESANSAKVDIDLSEIKGEVFNEILNMWSRVDEHRTNRKWQPIPSTFKQTLEAQEEDYSLPDFVKKLNKYMSVSENTIRREIKRGVIRCYQTDGGHRRIPQSEISSYLSYCDNKKKSISEV